MKTKLLHSVEFIITTNFFVSVILLLAGCFLSFSEQHSLFEFNQDLYGELVNHLKVTMAYLALTEIIICGYSAITQNIHAILLAGFFMILMVGSMSFYEKINSIELDDNLFLFFLYVGSSHLIFAIQSDLKTSVLE